MQEPTNLDVLLGNLSEHGGQQHQMIILDPDKIAILDNLSNGFSKQAIDLLICLPPFFVERDLSRMVVEKRPENTIGDVSKLLNA